MGDRRPGVLVVSLDLELIWGIGGAGPDHPYLENLRGAQLAARRILDLFRESSVHATWAAVGCLFFDNREDLIRAVPPRTPEYRDSRLSPYRYIRDSETLAPELHFAPELIESIQRTPGQEVGSHTFSHFYCLERGQTAEAFREDMEAARRAARSRRVEFKSFVFPKHQCNPEYFAELSRLGIRSYRGPQAHWAYRGWRRPGLRPVRRAVRFLDAYLNVSGPQVYAQEECVNGGSLANIRSSRFLGPVRPSLAPLEPLRLRRITRSLDRAAAEGKVFHLWWHPHNFGAHMERNLEFLRKVLDHAARLREEGTLVSRNMGELADSLGVGVGNAVGNGNGRE